MQWGVGTYGTGQQSGVHVLKEEVRLQEGFRGQAPY